MNTPSVLAFWPAITIIWICWPWTKFVYDDVQMTHPTELTLAVMARCCPSFRWCYSVKTCTRHSLFLRLSPMFTSVWVGNPVCVCARFDCGTVPNSRGQKRIDVATAIATTLIARYVSHPLFLRIVMIIFRTPTTPYKQKTLLSLYI